MKKKLAMLLVLILSMTALTACGRDDTATPDTSKETPVVETPAAQSNTVVKDFIELTLSNGWIHNAERSNSSIYLVIADSESTPKPEIQISASSLRTPNDQIAAWMDIYSSAPTPPVQIDNFTVNGIEYMGLLRDSEVGKYYHLTTSRGDFNPDEKGSITVELYYTDLEQVKPIMETFVIIPKAE